MTLRQKFILTLMGSLALGLIAVFVGIVITTNRPPDAGGAAPTEGCATPGDAQAPLEPCTALEGAVTSAAAILPTASILLGTPPGPLRLEVAAPPTPSVTPSPSPLPSATVLPPGTCPLTATGGLITEIQAIIAAMPGPGSNGFVAPDAAQIATWTQLVKALSKGDVASACALVGHFPYQVYQFTDLPFGRETYLLLKENLPVTVGWGTYVFRPGEARPLVVEVPHPLADWNSEVEGVEIFRRVRGRALLLAGTHRCANDDFSPCLGTTIACGEVEPYRLSDAAHSVQSMFQATHQALVPCDGENVALQLHVNSLSTCPDLFVSNGTLFPGALTNRLYQEIVEGCRDLTSDVADGSAEECGFTGGGGPQAIFSNGCGSNPTPDACTEEVTRPARTERFLSLEQSGAVMKDFDCLIEALQTVFAKDAP